MTAVILPYDRLKTASPKVTLHTIESCVHPHVGRQDRVVDLLPGDTVRDIARRYAPAHWVKDDVDLTVLVNGGKLEEDQENFELRPNDDVVLQPSMGAFLGLFVGGTGFFVAFFEGLIVAVALSAVFYAIQALMGKPRPHISSGNADSATYTVDGISTNYGPGFRIPKVYGIHRVGGQVISTDVYEQGIGDEIMSLLIVLSGSGPIARIGNVDLTVKQERNGLGGLKNPLWPEPQPPPHGIRLNGSTINARDAWIHLRAGTLHQTPVPGANRTSTVFQLNKPLHHQQTQKHTTGINISQLRVRVRFDAGLFIQAGADAQPFTVQFVSVVKDMNGLFLDSQQHSVTALKRSAFNHSFIVNLPGSEQYQVEFTRGTINDGATSVSPTTWAQAIEVVFGPELAFPTCALMSLDLRASEQVQGSEPKVTVPVWGTLVRWKDSGVWQLPSFFDAPSGLWPGRNPAWIAYDFLTSEDGLGRWFRANGLMIDETSLEQWARWCDQMVSDGKGGQHPRHQCDLVIDAGEQGWDILIKICRTGRCVPWRFGGRVSFKFEHPDQPINGFPRVLSQVFAESNIQDLVITYKNISERPNIYDARILDEELEWESNPITQEDPFAFGLNEPWKLGAEKVRREYVDFAGITRPAHARREMLYMHAVNRKFYSELQLTVPVVALKSEIGDLVGVQHDVPTFFDEATGGFRTTRGGTAATTIYLDHDVVLAVGRTYQVCIERNDTVPQIVTITSAAGSYPADTPITIASAQTFNPGAVVAFGEMDKVVMAYELVNIEAGEDLRFKLTAVLYDETAFDLEESVTIPLNEDNELVSAAFAEIQSNIPGVAEAQAVVKADGSAGLVSWTYPPERKGPARVYMRVKRDRDPSTMDALRDHPADWERVYEGQGSQAELPLEVGVDYEVAVVLQTPDGSWGSPS